MLWMRNAMPKGDSMMAYPSSLRIELSEFPELDKEVGEEVLFVVRGIIRSKSLTGMGDQNKCAEVEVREIGINKQQAIDRQRDMWTTRSSPKSLSSKADAFTEGITGGKPKSSRADGMVVLNDADIQLNKMISK